MRSSVRRTDPSPRCRRHDCGGTSSNPGMADLSGRPPRCEHEPNEPTTPASDLRQKNPERCSRAFLCVRSRGRSRRARGSALLNRHAKNYRVIIIDRPGFGHSSRPRHVIWTPDAQAQLIRRALDRLGVSHAIVLGHSWGASIAVALALKFPAFVRGLVLASGYYYPTMRPDVVAMSAPAICCGRCHDRLLRS